GIGADRISVTGNTVVEAVRRHLPGAGRRTALLARHGLVRDRYVLATMHRPENTDGPATLRTVLSELAALATDEVPVLLPLHPRTRARVEAERLGDLLAGVRVLEPLGYGDFLALARHAALLVSDSGGIQEECTVLGRPLVVVRRSTERPESMADFADLVAPGPELGRLARLRLAEGDRGLRRLAALPSPYGDGLAAERIARLVASAAEPTGPAESAGPAGSATPAGSAGSSPALAA
ncbi:UDP-N-acetylglucosamine 2-epimerase, partial [Streptomyces sp. NPDC059802]|uniref:UDP-N-acetylglucosamine 2-epimerase n=1 Tax=Streptomyces sp. NPDC059802 TaxID=3346952 RepID=UPI00364ECA20